MRKIITSLFLFWISFLSMVSAITIEIPDPEWNVDVSAITPWATQISGDESSFFETIQMINQYLWIWIWLVCMFFLVYSWIGLITANGNEAKMKSANKTLTGALIGIIICILSYAVVRVVVNLF